MTLVPPGNGVQLQSMHLSPYQPQQQVYPYLNQIAYRAPAPLALPPPRPTPLLSPPVQQYTPVAAAPQPTRYYNPLDPLGLFNNPVWHSLFPGLVVPQPQSVSAYESESNLDVEPVSKPVYAEVPKKAQLSPNEKLATCCQKRGLSPSCQTLCNYDTFTDRSLVTAVITNQCPGHELETAFNCATAMADHSECCIRNGIGSYNGGRCMVFCTTHLGNPGNTLQYIDCLQVFGRIKNCYREYHLTHPNLFGDF
ncbi:unnamed protein product [Gongylonema pulchrum]|uniref:DB domain-containing protein n=1 Tax=Gongylonema pulchrum TaxID=637853 RepID=A0A183E702_9BILA|nr:unnamed protein product [Gongylonema pulchrum]